MVARGDQPVVGYFVEVTRVLGTGRLLEVEVAESSSSPLEVRCRAISHAYEVDKIPKIPKRIMFKTVRTNYHLW